MPQQKAALSILVLLFVNLLLANLASGQRFWFQRTRARSDDNSNNGNNNIQPGNNPMTGMGTGLFSSVLPTPNGPFYGFPYAHTTHANRLLPFTVAGKCEGGKIYNVSKVEDLVLHYKSELECLFNAGLTPIKVPEGAFYGRFLSLINSELLNTFSNGIWQGTIVTQVECNGQPTYIGWNNFINRPIAPFIATVNPLTLNLAPGEYTDGKDSLINDYSQDYRRLCPDYRSFIRRNYESVPVRRTNLNSFVYPGDQIVDALRIVGKQEDGGIIYLGKSYMKDAFRTDQQAVTVAYWSVVNYDFEADPGLRPGEPLPPLDNSFKYMIPGVVDMLFRLSPLDNLITTPVRTTWKLAKEVVRTARNSVKEVAELLTGFSRRPTNIRRFRNSFSSDRMGRGRSMRFNNNY